MFIFRYFAKGLSTQTVNPGRDENLWRKRGLSHIIDSPKKEGVMKAWNRSFETYYEGPPEINEEF